MRENRTYGSEGGEAKSLPYPYRQAAELKLASMGLGPAMTAEGGYKSLKRLRTSPCAG